MGVLDAPAGPLVYQTATRRRLLIPVASRALPQNQVTSPNLSDGTTLGTTYRVAHTMIVTAHDIRLRFSNFYNNAGTETDGPNAITVRASVESPSNTMYPVYFSGSRDVVIQPGRYVDSDPLPIDLAAGTVFFTRTYVTVAQTGYKWPLGITAITANGEGDNRANTDLTTTSTVPGVTDHLYGPSAILGLPATPPAAVIGIIGDSIAAGNPGETTPWTDWGYMLRALGNHYAYQTVAFPSDNASLWGSLSTRLRRMPFLEPCTHVIVQLGANSISSTFSAVQGQLQTIYAYLNQRGIKVYQTTITPQTTSTDGFITVANQSTTTKEATRLALNAWIRTTPSPLAGYFEIADLAETARDSGKWKAAARTVTDMVTTASSATITSATAAFTGADVGSAISIAGAGSAGGVLVSTILTVTNSTTATLVATGIPSTTVSGATAGIGLQTSDGIHPSSLAAAALASGVTTSVFGAQAA